MSKTIDKIHKTKGKTLQKISSKKKLRKWTYIQKLQKTYQNIKEKIEAKLLLEPIRKTQRQCKTTMADLERNHKKSSEEISVSTNNT